MASKGCELIPLGAQVPGPWLTPEPEAAPKGAARLGQIAQDCVGAPRGLSRETLPPSQAHSESPSRCPSVDRPTPSLLLGLPKVTAAFSAACTQLSPSETSLPLKDPSHGSPSFHYQGPLSHTHSAGFLHNKSLLPQISPLCL